MKHLLLLLILVGTVYGQAKVEYLDYYPDEVEVVPSDTFAATPWTEEEWNEYLAKVRSAAGDSVSEVIDTVNTNQWGSVVYEIKPQVKHITLEGDGIYVIEVKGDSVNITIRGE